MPASTTAPPVPQARLSSWLSSFRNAALSGSPYTTVTVLPPRPFFSIRSLATSFDGIEAVFAVVLHLQWFAGQPQSGHVRPTLVEKTSRALRRSVMRGIMRGDARVSRYA